MYIISSCATSVMQIGAMQIRVMQTRAVLVRALVTGLRVVKLQRCSLAVRSSLTLLVRLPNADQLHFLIFFFLWDFCPKNVPLKQEKLAKETKCS